MTTTDYIPYPYGCIFDKRGIEKEIEDLIEGEGKKQYIYKVKAMENSRIIYVEWIKNFEGRGIIWSSIKELINEVLELEQI